MTTPGQTYGVSPFFDPVARDLGLSRAAVATAYTIGTLAGVLPEAFVRRWIDRRGPRLAGVLIGLALAHRPPLLLSPEPFAPPSGPASLSIREALTQAAARV